MRSASTRVRPRPTQRRRRGRERTLRGRAGRAAIGRSDGGRRLRRDRGGKRSRRLHRGDPRAPARLASRARRARRAGRHLPELGLHPDEGAATRFRDPAPAAPSRCLWLPGKRRALRPRQAGGPFARGRQATLGRREAPDEEERDSGVRGTRARGGEGSRRGRARGSGRIGAESAAHRARDRSPRARAARNRSRWRAHLDLQGGDASGELPQLAAGGGLGRDRRRVRELLPRPRRRGDAGRDPAPDPPGRRRGDRRSGAQGLSPGRACGFAPGRHSSRRRARRGSGRRRAARRGRRDGSVCASSA